MKTSDVMSQEVISVRPDATVSEAIKLMMENHISGLPVVDASGRLVGIVTQGDFLRRSELGTEKRRPRWISFMLGPNTQAAEYVQTHARRVNEIMTRSVAVAHEDTPLAEVVDIMERRHVKRLPVVRGDIVVGIISRTNLIEALAALKPAQPTAASDTAIRERLITELDKNLSGAGRNNIVVKDGVVDLWGYVFSDRERDAVQLAAENTPGVKQVRNHLAWIEPLTGMILDSPREDGGRAVEQTSVH